MKIGFTGTQLGMTPLQIARLTKLLHFHKPSEFHHGDCIGADAQAHDIVETFPVRIVIHPPTNDSKRAFKWADEGRLAKPYLERNHDIVDETDLLLVAPKSVNEELRSGTWATWRYAVKMKKPTIILEPS